MTQESPIFDLSHRLPENPDIFYLKAVRIPPSSKRKINNNIYVCNYDKNDEADKEKCKVDYGGYFGSFFGAIADKKDFEDNRENPVSMRGEGHVEVEDQSDKLVLLSNANIYAMKKDNFMLSFFREV